MPAFQFIIEIFKKKVQIFGKEDANSGSMSQDKTQQFVYVYSLSIS